MTFQKRLSVLLISFILLAVFFLPHNSYAIDNVVISDGFDFPLGPPNGVGYANRGTGGLGWLERYDYTGDGVREFHPGEDWNEAGNGLDFGNDNKDYGDPVYAIGNGVVRHASYSGLSWGYLVLVEHKLGNGGVYWSQYAHLSKLGSGVTPGGRIMRGTVLGYVGDFYYRTGNNIHLHFEIRKKYLPPTAFVMNWPKEKVEEYYVEPTAFINSHRPVEKTEVEVKDPVEGKTEISWTPTIRPDFEKYEIHRTESAGTCGISSSSLIETVTDKSITSYIDKRISTGKTYYYCVRTYFSNGLISTSPEKSVIVKLEIIQITTEPTFQMNPTMADGRLYWEDNRTENNTWPRKLYFYDLESKEQGSVSIGVDGAKRPMSPNANGGRVVFVSEDTKGTGRNIYCYDFNTKSAYPISQEKGEQLGPVVSDEGVVVWMDLRNGSNFDLYYLDVTKAEGEIPFVVGAGNQRNPAIWKNRVVWMDSRVGNRHDLYYKEIGGEEKLIATNVGSGLPRIYGDYVTWDYAGKVWLANVVTGEKREIASAVTTSGVSIHGQKIVYGIKEGELFYLHVYDISTKEDRKIDFPLNYLCFPVIYQNFVAFDHSVLSGTPDKNIYLVFL